jgi:hypothetical protein
VEDLIQRKRTIFNNAFDTKADLDFNRRFSIKGMQLILASSASKVTIERVLALSCITFYICERTFKIKPDPAILYPSSSSKQIVL